MLIVKVYVNEKQIDEVWVHNTGTTYGGDHIYNLRHPHSQEVISTIAHKRSKGYRPLLRKALRILQRKKVPTRDQVEGATPVKLPRMA